jgi:hypothetical protein
LKDGAGVKKEPCKRSYFDQNLVTKECQMVPQYLPTWFLVQEGYPSKG